MAISFQSISNYFSNPDFTKNIGNIGLGVQALGAVNSAIGNYYNAKATRDTLRTNAQLAQINSEIAELGRQSTIAQGNRAASAVKMKGSRIKSQQKAQQAASGVDLNVGSAKEVRVSTDVMKEVDANEIQRSALLRSFGFDFERISYLNQSRMATIAADATSPTSALMNSLLAGAGKVGASWYSLRKWG